MAEKGASGVVVLRGTKLEAQLPDGTRKPLEEAPLDLRKAIAVAAKEQLDKLNEIDDETILIKAGSAVSAYTIRDWRIERRRILDEACGMACLDYVDPTTKKKWVMPERLTP